MSECEAFGMTPIEAALAVGQVIAAMNTWQGH